MRTVDSVFLVETKAQEQINNPNVQRKLKAATAWCERINTLPETPHHWHYVLLGERLFADWRQKRGRLTELLDFARVRLLAGGGEQGKLEI